MDTKDKTDFSTDLDKIAQALGHVSTLAYSPPHDYPMSVPKFSASPSAKRARPSIDKLRLYVHIPFCNYACSFCFFSKNVGATRDQMARYVQALKKELDWVTPGLPLSQLFVGGGTPTVLPADLLDEVLRVIFDRMASEGSQIHTVETSPESISSDHIGVLQDHHIGRVSMGIQSLEEHVLDTVNRRHKIHEALEACRLLVENGFIVNVDLMYGLPEQTQESFQRDLEILASTDVHSFTFYNLRVNENTPLGKSLGFEQRLDLKHLMRWRRFVKETAEERGYIQTRWHTFKRLDSIAAKHDRAAHFTPEGMGYQLGVGMSARSQLGYTLYRNNSRLDSYLERVEAGESPVEEVLALTLEDRKTQFVARSLGDGKPLVRTEYEKAFGCSIDENFGEPIQRLTQNGLIQDTQSQLCLTETGKLVHDFVMVAFYPQSALDWLQQKSHSWESRKAWRISSAEA